MDSNAKEDLGVWKIVESCLAEFGLIPCQIYSYNYFISRIHLYLAPPFETRVVEPKNVLPEAKDMIHRFTFSNPRLRKPKVNEADPNKKVANSGVKIDHSNDLHIISPYESRARGLLYSSSLHLDIKHEVSLRDAQGVVISSKSHLFEQIYVGEIPIMVRSKVCTLKDPSDKTLVDFHECEFDRGGYFIVNGIEKAMIGQEKMAQNRMFVKAISPNLYTAEIRSQSERVNLAASQFTISMKNSKTKGWQWSCQMPYLDPPIPLMILLTALGIKESDLLDIILGYEKTPQTEEIKQYLITAYETFLCFSEFTTQEGAIEYIQQIIPVNNNEKNKVKDPAKKQRDLVINMLNKDFLPHMGNTESDFGSKAKFLALMARDILAVATKKRDPDNRDLLHNKRLDDSGALMKSMMCEIMRQIVRDISSEAMKVKEFTTINNLRQIFKRKGFFQHMKKIIGKGVWGNTVNPIAKTGVTATLQSMCQGGYISQLNRFNTPLGREQKLSPPRQLIATHWGHFCATETPESGGIGLVKNRALLAHVSLGYSSLSIQSLLSPWYTPLQDCSIRQIHTEWRVFLNGYWCGCTIRAHELVKFLRDKRRRMTIHWETGISINEMDKIVSIRTDPGRLMRPLLIVTDGKLVANNDKINRLYTNPRTRNIFFFMQEGMVEYIDVEESANLIISMWPHEVQNYNTHCEIHPSTIHGHVAAATPLVPHNPTIRLNFNNAMSKQACGTPSLNFKYRMPPMSKHLLYPQRPIVTTQAAKLTTINDMPAGQEVVMLVGSFHFNQEDGIIMSQKFIDMGGASIVHTRTWKDEQQQLGNHYTENFGTPPPKTFGVGRNSNFGCLDPDGFVSPGAKVTNGDILIGKHTPIQSFAYQYKDLSQDNRCTMGGYVEDVMLTTNASGFTNVKVEVVSIEKPVSGDKISSRFAQKGVLSVLIMKPQDMPYSTKTGATPDIIINPHAFPSRMTIAQIIDPLFGKLGALSGKRFTINCFDEPEKGKDTKTWVSDELEKIGWDRHGREEFTNGKTGEKFQTKFFVGLEYYQYLKHFAKAKIHARAEGPVNCLTRQPVEGRAQNGGSRFGEMERDCLIAYGAASSLNGRLMRQSDETEFWLCNTCGFIAYDRGKDSNNPIVMCTYCNTKNTNVKKIKTGHAWKLLVYELACLHVGIRQKVVSVTSQQRRLPVIGDVKEAIPGH